MTRPLPELVTKARHAWQIAPPNTHDPHATNARPHQRRTTGDTEHTDPQAHATRILGLVAARYNTRRPREIAKQLLGHDNTQTLDAAQELRNRHLAQLARPDLPQPRYYLPEQLAAIHAQTNSRNRALDIAALIHHPGDLATYLDTLARHKHDELREAASSYAQELTNQLEQLTNQLQNKPNSRFTVHYRKMRLSPAEYAAWRIAEAITAADTNLTNAHQRDTNTKQTRAAQRSAEHRQRQRQRKTGHNLPLEAEQLSGWYAVIPNKPPREIAHTGRLGRRRIATNAGKNPSRLHNYYGDPMRRIFTRKTRGTNALVIVDVSGSMSLSTDDLDQIMKASTGATVIAYSSSGGNEPNTHLLAHNARRVRTLPRFAGGNGIDAPAALWAIKNYRKQNAPVLWITDGRATGIGDHSSYDLRRQCKRLAQKYGVLIAPDVPEALHKLNQLRHGQTPKADLDTLHR